MNEHTSELLEARAYIYLLFQSIFGSEPTATLLETVCSEVSQSALELFIDETGDANTSYAQAVQTVFEIMEATSNDLEARVEELKREYTKLYIGPEQLAAYPWESIYVSDRHLMFQESTLNVRNAYRVQGLLPEEYPHVADDHIALECAFMAQLGTRAKKAYETSEQIAFQTALEASEQFLKDHLLVWVPDYVIDLNKVSFAKFYQTMAMFALEFMKLDKQNLDELLIEV